MKHRLRRIDQARRYAPVSHVQLRQTVRPDRADVPADQPTAEMRSPCRTGDGDGSDSTNRHCSSSYHDESRPTGGREGAERPMRPLLQRPCLRRKNSQRASTVLVAKIDASSCAGSESFFERETLGESDKEDRISRRLRASCRKSAKNCFDRSKEFRERASLPSFAEVL